MPTSTAAPPGSTARQPDPPGLKGLKILVVVLGVLIVVLFGVLVAGMISRIAGMGKSPEPDPDAAAVPAAVAPFGTASVTRPPGAELADVMTSGGLLFFHFHAVDGQDTVVVFDPARRATIGEIAVVDDR